MEIKPGFYAKSLAGNDKGRIYAVKKDEGRFVLLNGGDGRVLRKNKKHIQVIKKMEVKEVCQRQM